MSVLDLGPTFELRLVAVALFLAGLVAAILVLRMRRAGLAIHRQIDQLRAEIHTARSDAFAEFAAQQHQVTRQDEESSRSRDRVDQMAAHLSQMRDQVQDTNVRAVQLQEHLHDTRLELHGKLDGLYGAVSEAAEFIARRPAAGLPMSTSELESLSEAELLAMAESIAILRPLVPFPRWRFDAEMYNPDLSYQLRRWFWQYFNNRKSQAPMILPWHGPTRFRAFLGNDLSSQIYISGCWEPNEFAFLDRILRPGMTFFDAGANEGIYSVFAAARLGPAGSVWAFEPSHRELERLRFNLNLNGLSARVCPIALADCNGQAELTVGGYQHEPHNTLGAFAYTGIESAGEESVEIRRLDDFLSADPPARIDVMKFDVEGAELRLLLGAQATLREYRPILLFEANDATLRHQQASRDSLLEMVRSQGYSLFAFDRVTGLPVPSPPAALSDNIIGVPHEKSLPADVSSPVPVR